MTAVTIRTAGLANIPDYGPVDTLPWMMIVGNSAFCWEGRVDGYLACVWGLIPPSLLSDQAYLWMHTTPLINEHRFLFTRHSQRVLEQMLEIYPVINGHCFASATDSIRWIRWLGGVFGEPEGIKVPFVIRKK